MDVGYSAIVCRGGAVHGTLWGSLLSFSERWNPFKRVNGSRSRGTSWLFMRKVKPYWLVEEGGGVSRSSLSFNRTGAPFGRSQQRPASSSGSFFDRNTSGTVSGRGKAEWCVTFKSQTKALFRWGRFSGIPEYLWDVSPARIRPLCYFIYFFPPLCLGGRTLSRTCVVLECWCLVQTSALEPRETI